MFLQKGQMSDQILLVVLVVMVVLVEQMAVDLMVFQTMILNHAV